MKSTLRNMVICLTGTAVVMGTMLAAVHTLTAQPIERAATRTKCEALAAVLPPFDNDPTQTATEVTVDGESRPVTIYSATQAGQPVGQAVESWTNDGFSGEIIVMVGFDNGQRVSGYRVLQHAETPGLGAKADEWFCDPTGQRSIIGTDSPLTVAKDGGDIDGITAATITSRAFLDAVNRARRALEAKHQMLNAKH